MFKLHWYKFEEAGDAAEDEIIPPLESDNSTEDEGGIKVTGTSRTESLASLEDVVKQLAVDGNSKEEDRLQPLEDTEDTEESPWSFDPWLNRMEPPWNLRSEEMYFSDTNKNNVLMRLYCKVSQLQSFIEIRWRNYPWEHHEDKGIMDGLEDIVVMIFKIKRLDAAVLRDPVHAQFHDPK